MSVVPNQPAASFKFNNFQEIKSHSSILYNERMAILFYILDMKSITMNTYFSIESIQEVRGVLLQIYKNIRTLIRNNPTMRATLNLETKDEGVYVPDVAFGIVNQMIQYCEVNSYTSRRNYIISQELNKVEMLIKDILQYYHYFIRPDFRQKPDIEIATEVYKEIADKQTIEELREIVGKSHKIDFEGLGTSRVEIANEIKYDENVDSEIPLKEELQEEDEE
jgi:hypothetical protein